MATFEAAVFTISMIKLFFCWGNSIHHYFRDIFPLLKLSCSSIYENELLVILVGRFNLLATVESSSTLVISYSLTFFKCPHLMEGSKLLLPTSHFIAVAVFYGSAIYMYFKPTSSSSDVDQQRVASVFYTMMIPMLNLLIYSLRNKDVENVLRKVMG